MRELITQESIKVRNFTKLKTYKLPKYKFRISGGREFPASDFPILIVFHVLRQFYVKLPDLPGELKRLSDNFKSDYSQAEKDAYYNEDAEKLIKWSIPFILPDYELLGD